MVSFKSNVFHASILVVLLSMTLSDVRIPSENIKTICTKTTIPAYCQELLGSAPKAATADIKGLAKITLDLANSNAAKTLTLLNSLIPKTTDCKLQESYKSCSEHFDDAIGFLKHSKDYFNKGDYSGMNVQASAAITETGDYVNETKDLAVDPTIKKGSNDFDQICRIILAVSNLL